MPRAPRHPLFTGLTATSIGTLVSRVLGVLRESAAAGLLGLSQGGVMDAYVVAFRIPNLFRGLLGEGAMTASYVPVLAEGLERDPRGAWKLVSSAAVCLSLALLALTLLAEFVCAMLWRLWGDEPSMRLLLGLTAAMLPYAVLICLAALATATLQTLGEFRLPATVPSILNLCWILGAWFIAPRITADRQQQAFVMAGCVLVGGVLQLLVQLPRLRRLGFRFQVDFAASRAALGRIARAMAPMTLGLAVTQINTLSDSLIACGLAATPGQSTTIAWLGGAAYPLKQGAAAAVWYGERVYQFPLGLLGVGVATVIFPLLARHAAAGQHARVGSDLSLGLRLVLFAGIPASAGLFLIAEPLARLLFEHHNFTAADTPRAAAMIAWFSVGVWAYCAIPVLVRGFYAIGDRATPVRIGVACVAINIVLDATLIWPLAEVGLAISTVVAATIQVFWLAHRFSRSQGSLEWPRIAGTVARTLAGTAVMAVATFGTLRLVPASNHAGNAFVRVVLPIGAAIATYLLAFRLFGGPERLAWLPRNSFAAKGPLG